MSCKSFFTLFVLSITSFLSVGDFASAASTILAPSDNFLCEISCRPDSLSQLKKVLARTLEQEQDLIEENEKPIEEQEVILTSP